MWFSARAPSRYYYHNGLNYSHFRFRRGFCSKKATSGFKLDVTNETSIRKQYTKFREEYPDCIVFFRVGDFYEMYDTQAREVAPILNIKLARNKAQKSDMAGVPSKVGSKYITSLVSKGYKVCVVEQESEKNINSNILDRYCHRVVTPGTYIAGTACLGMGKIDLNLSKDMNTEEDFQEWNGNLFDVETDELNSSLVSVSPVSNGSIGLSWMESSTGHLKVLKCDASSRLQEALQSLEPTELILPRSIIKFLDFMNAKKDHDAGDLFISSGEEGFNCSLSAGKNDCLAIFAAEDSFEVHLTSLKEYFEKSGAILLFNENWSQPELQSLSVLIRYLDYCFPFGKPKVIEFDNNMKDGDGKETNQVRKLHMDRRVWASMELFENSSRSRPKDTLFGLMNKSRTRDGTNLLKERMKFPSANVHEILNRQKGIQLLLDDFVMFEHTRLVLSEIKSLGSLKKIVGRLNSLSQNPGPRDLASLAHVSNFIIREFSKREFFLAKGEGGEFGNAIDIIQKSGQNSGFMNILHEIKRVICHHSVTNDSALDDLRTAINMLSRVPVSPRAVGYVAQGINPQLDEARQMMKSLKEIEQELQEKYPLLDLSLKTTPTLGTYVAIKPSNSHLVNPESFYKNRKLRDTKTEARFMTVEVEAFNSDRNNLQHRVSSIEREILRGIYKDYEKIEGTLSDLVKAVAIIDYTYGLCTAAEDFGLYRPIVDESACFSYENGRHLVLDVKGNFTPNSLDLSVEKPTWLITGPNMGGKSTFLRQSAHMIILAQMGSFVPAQNCRMGIFDEIFCRIGAQDDISHGRSTFFVEMEEVADMLNRFTAKSFVVVDEVGRGTAYRSGLAISQAVLEEILKKKCRGLFGSHFHTLAHIAKANPSLGLHHFTLIERGPDDIPIYTFRLEPGYSTESYGISVAKMAGVPLSVLQRAKYLLTPTTQPGD